MWTRIGLKETAKDVFARCRWSAIAVSVIFALVCGGSGGVNVYDSVSDDSGIKDKFTIPDEFLVGAVIVILVVMAFVLVISVVVNSFICNPLEIGTRKFFLEAQDNENVSFREIAFAFSNGYIDGVVTMFLRDLYIFLWSLLFVIPGIVKKYEYRMVPYIIAENPQISRKRAFELSKMMMDGEKWDTFVLDLSFIGWILLSAITCGLVGVFYYLPYYNCTHAAQYVVLRDNLVNNDPRVGMDIRGFMEYTGQQA